MVNNWHYHPEIELLFMKRTAGNWLIGNHIGHYQSGDVVMLGANLPHCFRHEYDYIIKRDEMAGETICVKFMPDVFGDRFINLPEAAEIKKLFLKANTGLRLLDTTKINVAKLIDKMDASSPGKKLIYLLSVLEEIAGSRQYETLSSTGFTALPGSDINNDRIKLVFDYTFNHYCENISLDKMASLLNMSKESFCRYFKSKTKKTYIQFLMEVRIGFACRLLVEDEKNVTEISYHCGYNNISHFNHQFKMITHKNPLEYKRVYSACY